MGHRRHTARQRAAPFPRDRHPEPYLKAAARLGLDPAHCLAVEDSPVGARAAKAAGMLTVAWPQRPDLVFEAVDHRIEALNALDWETVLAGTG